MASRLDKLKGKTAVVTGASSGIGLCFASELAQSGCRVVMISNQQKELIEASERIAARSGTETFPLCIDLTERESASEIAEWLDAHGIREDILINNAGIFSFNPILETPGGKIDCFIDLHIRAVTMLSRTFGARMASRGYGHILNMSSMSCWMPMPGLAMYAATKAYIRVFSRSLHYELRQSGVKVTVACPGGIATNLFGLPESLKKLAVNIGAIQKPEKFVRHVLKKMLSGKQQYINGALNRLSIPAVGCMPTSVRMMVKTKLLDRNIKRP